MPSLAEALVSLERAATERRTARRELREATAVVAKAIAAPLRVGDSVTVNGSEYRVVRLGWLGRQGPGWSAVPCPDPEPVLCRNKFALWDPRMSWWDGHDMQYPFGHPYDDDDPCMEYPLAGRDTILAFAAEAEDVIKAFTNLMQGEVETFNKAATALAHLEPGGSTA